MRLPEMFGRKQKDLVGTKKALAISWWRLGTGIALVLLGLLSGAAYMADIKNMAAAFGAIVGLAGGGSLIYWAFRRDAMSGGFVMAKRVRGDENAIVHIARLNGNGNGKAIPWRTLMAKIEHVPPGARPHYLRNIKRHVYELRNVPGAPRGQRKLVPVILPDKKPFPPAKYTIAATMQPFKDAIEYVPPSRIQSIGPVALIIAMIVVGILIVITTTGNTQGV